MKYSRYDLDMFFFVVFFFFCFCFSVMLVKGQDTGLSDLHNDEDLVFYISFNTICVISRQ